MYCEHMSFNKIGIQNKIGGQKFRLQLNVNLIKMKPKHH